jgi:hypothetical protein
MNRCDDFDLGGVPDLEALRSTDELLDRLARREPGPRDLDDPVVAALAVLAGDVDLAPVPVRDTERALAGVGLWPLPSVWGVPQAEEHEPAERSRSLLPAEVGIAAPRPIPAGETAPAVTRPEPLRRPRRSARPRPQLDHPRVLRLRPRAGVAAAAALVLLGGGMSVAVGNDSLNPLTGLGNVMGRWTDDRTDQQRQAQKQLTEKVKKAKDLAKAGQKVAAAQLLIEVQGELGTLTGDDQKKLATEMAEVAESLPPGSGGESGSTAVVGGPFDDARSSSAGTSIGDPGTAAGADPSAPYVAAPSATWRSGSGWAGSRPTTRPGAAGVVGQQPASAAQKPPKSSDQHDERVRQTTATSTGATTDTTSSTTTETTTTTTAPSTTTTTTAPTTESTTTSSSATDSASDAASTVTAT